MKAILFGFVFMLSLQVGASRSVDIAIKSGTTDLTLANPSTIAVNYGITCYKADGSGTVLSLASEVLAPNARKVYAAATPDSGKCASNAAPVANFTQSSGGKAYLCSGSVTYANANNLCGTGNSFCFPNTSTSCTDWSTFCAGGNYWLKTDANTQFKTGCGAFGAVTAGKVIVGGMSGATGQARSAAGAFDFYWMHEDDPTFSNGATCCESPEYASYCRITISTTDPNARLLSPEFKGSTAF